MGASHTPASQPLELTPEFRAHSRPRAGAHAPRGDQGLAYLPAFLAQQALGVLAGDGEALASALLQQALQARVLARADHRLAGNGHRIDGAALGGAARRDERLRVLPAPLQGQAVQLLAERTARGRDAQRRRVGHRGGELHVGLRLARLNRGLRNLRALRCIAGVLLLLVGLREAAAPHAGVEPAVLGPRAGHLPPRLHRLRRDLRGVVGLRLGGPRAVGHVLHDLADDARLDDDVRAAGASACAATTGARTILFNPWEPRLRRGVHRDLLSTVDQPHRRDGERLPGAIEVPHRRGRAPVAGADKRPAVEEGVRIGGRLRGLVLDAVGVPSDPAGDGVQPQRQALLLVGQLLHVLAELVRRCHDVPGGDRRHCRRPLVLPSGRDRAQLHDFVDLVRVQWPQHARR
mmetsp:Transcript_12325/g.33714  ORF Transcript_12325/g.33714 Transcript_12325/m.33714 type:complete len:405 (-) Transcript_12325:439-1653(-)